MNTEDPNALDDARVCDLSRIEAVPSRFAPAPDLAQLRVDLTSVGDVLAARLVREDQRHYADTIVANLRGRVAVSRLLVAQVSEWGRSRDEAIAASIAVNQRPSKRCPDGCEDCALIALATASEASMCAMCRAEVGS